MHKRSNEPVNLRRSAAGKLNRAKWKGVTPAGREKLRQNALKHKPWQFSTGPRTPEGKAKAAQNGKNRQKGEKSVRELRAELGETTALLAAMAASRQAIEGESRCMGSRINNVRMEER